MDEATVVEVFALAVATALATGLGALPFLLFRGTPPRAYLGVANALAGGAMVGASLGLLYEGGAYGIGRTAVGAALGVVFILVARRRLADREGLVLGALSGADALKALAIVGVMTIHSFTEGVGVGVSFGGGDALGLFVATAIAVHNVPEGLAISLVLVPRGASVGRAAAWSVFSSLPQPLMAVPAFLFVETFEPVLPLGLGFAAGAMLWLVAVELIPDALAAASARTVWGAAAVATLAMIAFQLLIGV